MNAIENHAHEVSSGQRFEFGANWAKFLGGLTEAHIGMAEQSLCNMLEMKTLAGKRFIDIGSGSGLFSLAARRLGAQVHSLDYDRQSVECTRALRSRFFANDALWTVEEASALDKPHLHQLGTFDIVYSWGVLHHTGSMWQGLENAGALVAPGGRLFVAIYNDQGQTSRTWLSVKKTYNRLPPALRWLVVMPALLRLWGPTTMRDLLLGRPFHTWRHYADDRMRGMHPWYDLIDWVGGLPFEVASPEAMFNFYKGYGFALEKMKTCAGGLGCNEFVFSKQKTIGPGA